MVRKYRHRVLLTFIMIYCACGLPRTHFYSMEFPHVQPGPGPSISRHLTVQRFRADQALMDDRILYRESPTEVNYYQYHRWTNAPAELVTQYFLRNLKNSAAFTRVTAQSDGAAADLILQGRLHRFEEVDRGKEVLVAFSLELELLDAKSRAPVWRQEGECVHPVESHDMAGVVQGLYRCMDETGSRLLGSMQESARRMK
jgi:ABC-type uncharacterized transport system auxiliary subunit